MSEHWIVVGGGLGGLVGAYVLARAGRRVTLVERGGALGGSLAAHAWNGYRLDAGCHLFGNESDESTGLLLEILGGERGVVPVHVRFASIFNGQKTEGFELPSLASFGSAAVEKMLAEVVTAAVTPAPAPSNLEDLLVARYGPRAAGLLDLALHKVFRTPARELAPEAVNATTFRRIRLLDDAAARLLKGVPALDERLAAGSADDPMVYYRDRVRLYPHRSFYPARHGMGGFVEAAEARLAELGAKVVLRAEMQKLECTSNGVVLETATHGRVAADAVLWTAGLARLEPLLGGGQDLGSLACNVPMLLYYFGIERAQETGYSYVNSYDAGDLVFRALVPGAYGRENCPEGRSYVCCEVPTVTGSAEWQEPESFVDRVWGEAVRFGVAEGRPLEHCVRKLPVSYKAPRRDYAERSRFFRARVVEQPGLFVTDEWLFSMNRTIAEVKRIVGGTGTPSADARAHGG